VARKRYTIEQIIRKLREAEVELPKGGDFGWYPLAEGGTQMKNIVIPMMIVSLALASQSLAHGPYPQLGTPNPDPAHVTVSGGDIAITPTGVDDHANIEWAMNNTTTGGTILLDGYDFYLSRCVDVLYFNGTLKGLGRDITTLHMMDGFEFSQINYDLLDWQAPLAVAVWYDRAFDHLGIERPYTGVANLIMSDFTLSAKGDSAEVWLEHGVQSKSLGGIWVVGVDRDFDPYTTPTDVNTRFERLEIRGISNDNSDGYHRNLSNMFWPIVLEALIGGRHELEDVRFIQTGYWLTYLSHDLEMAISDVYAESCTAFDGEVSALRFADITNSAVYVTGFKSVDSGGIQVAAGWLLYAPHQPQEPSTYLFEHNNIERRPGAWWGGFELTDYLGPGKKSTFVISSNRIVSEGHQRVYGSIYTEGIDGLVATNNIIEGSGQCAVYIEPWSVFGFPGGSGGFFGGNNLENFTTDDSLVWYFLEGASYFVGHGASDYTFVGNVKKKIVDYGTNNYIVGLTKRDTPLGQDVKDAMMEKREAIERMKAIGR
jgi:hypothetical protein